MAAARAYSAGGIYAHKNEGDKTKATLALRQRRLRMIRGKMNELIKVK